MFTGLHPSQHGAFESRFLLRDNLPHLVPALKAFGYDTIGISTNSLVSPASGLCQDFDEFHDLGAEDFSRILQGLRGSGDKTADPEMPACLQSALSPKARAGKSLAVSLGEWSVWRSWEKLVENAAPTGSQVV